MIEAEAVDHVCSDSAADGCLLLEDERAKTRCRQTTSGGETGQTSTHHHNIDVLRGVRISCHRGSVRHRSWFRQVKCLALDLVLQLLRQIREASAEV